MPMCLLQTSPGLGITGGLLPSGVRKAGLRDQLAVAELQGSQCTSVKTVIKHLVQEVVATKHDPTKDDRSRTSKVTRFAMLERSLC